MAMLTFLRKSGRFACCLMQTCAISRTLTHLRALASASTTIIISAKKLRVLLLCSGLPAHYILFEFLPPLFVTAGIKLERLSIILREAIETVDYDLLGTARQAHP